MFTRIVLISFMCSLSLAAGVVWGVNLTRPAPVAKRAAAVIQLGGAVAEGCVLAYDSAMWRAGLTQQEAAAVKRIARSPVAAADAAATGLVGDVLEAVETLLR